MKKTIFILILLLTVAALGACSMPQVQKEDTAIPHRMVAQIDIVSFPDDPSMNRSYTDDDILTAIIRMVQGMETAELPEDEPRMDGEKAYFSITATYANGEKEAYHILDKQYMQHRNGQWCVIDSAKADELAAYIRNTPSS